MISTGSRVADLPMPGLAKLGCMTSDDALQHDSLPQSFVVLGGGAVRWSSLSFLPVRSQGDAAPAQPTLSSRRVTMTSPAKSNPPFAMRGSPFPKPGFRLSTRGRTAREKIYCVQKRRRQHEVRAEAGFHGLGRSPNTDSLALKNAGSRPSTGPIICDTHMRTSTPQFSPEAISPGPEIVHPAVQQGEIAAHNILYPGPNPSQRITRVLISVVFTDPQAATVGLTEKAAKAGGIPYLSASYPFNDHGKSIIMDAMQAS
ncbi:MAG: hypothetical protein Ct9H300mP32_1570 [Verrucomicrobiota bacterium]|nr:MAG: hypothetical protein Ct9H300mP32_1570 [Verrucomicrobiota bacterium]